MVFVILATKPAVQKRSHIVLSQHVPPTLCQVNRNTHGFSKGQYVVGHALPVFGAHVDLRVERAGHETIVGELAQPCGVRRAEVHGFVCVIELTHDGREQQDAPHKRRQLGLSVQKQIATK